MRYWSPQFSLTARVVGMHNMQLYIVLYAIYRTIIPCLVVVLRMLNDEQEDGKANFKTIA